MKQKWSTLLLATGAILLVFCVIYSPSSVFKASGEGLAIWWRIIFPGLLPFLVISHMLVASGFVHGIGTLLEPFTKKWLGIPGFASFIIPLGMTAGFPAGADAAAKLHQQGQLTVSEAEKISSLAHFCSPMLIIIVIGTGFLNEPWVGIVLLAIHWLAGIVSGFTTHLLLKSEQNEPSDSATPLANTKRTQRPTSPQSSSRIRQAIHSMTHARQADGRSFGRLLGDAVSTSVQTLMMIGGYILIFAVIIHVLHDALSEIVPSFLIAGLSEVHLGAFTIISEKISLSQKCALLSAFLGFSGLCSILQVQSLLKSTGGIGKFFMLHRFLHGSYALILSIILWHPLTNLIKGSISAYSYHIGATTYTGNTLPALHQLVPIIKWQFTLFIVMIAISILYSLIWKPKQAINTK